MSKESTSIDYLFEDPPIPNQQYALVSIVGPNMSQKCDVWGLKVRGTADTLEKAKSMSQKILRIDNNYDIYTVEVGKFFPLVVDPFQIKEVEYQNDQLNTLIKSYLENRENANEQWHSRKNEMVQDAIKEGKSKEKQKEHPISILQQIYMQEEDIQKGQLKISSLRDKLKDNYTEEELENAQSEFNKMLENIQLQNTETLDDNNDQESEVNKVLEKIKNLEIEKEKLESENDQNEEIERLSIQINLLKEKLNDPDVINNYINNNYENPQIKLV
jgi:chromosome segregation ATPase